MLENNLDWIALLLAMLSGILMAIQGAFNTALSKTIGLVETTFMVNLIGVVILVAPSATPWWLYRFFMAHQLMTSETGRSINARHC